MASVYLDKLKHAVEALHGCSSEHQTTGYIHEEMDGQTLWKGVVDTFVLTGHPKASKAYAWAWKDAEGKARHVAILNLPPVNSPRTAVQAAIATGQLR